jgi:hypothetical protein
MMGYFSNSASTVRGKVNLRSAQPLTKYFFDRLEMTVLVCPQGERIGFVYRVDLVFDMCKPT